MNSISGNKPEFFKRSGDLFHRLNTRRFHLPARYPSDGVVMDARELGDGGPGAATLVGREDLEDRIEFHNLHYADAPYFSQAFSPRVFPHHPVMKESDEDSHLLTAQKNLRMLVSSEKLSVNAWSIRYGLVQSTINRIVTGKLDPSTATLQEISDALARKGVRIHAWQFLAPEFGKGLHELKVNSRGAAEAIPVPAPPGDAENRENLTSVRTLPEKTESGMRPQSRPTWNQTSHPARRSTDKKRKDA